MFLDYETAERLPHRIIVFGDTDALRLPVRQPAPQVGAIRLGMRSEGISASRFNPSVNGEATRSAGWSGEGRFAGCLGIGYVDDGAG